ncbi:hypothetical protein TTHERM_00847050 (macronuclear) [Tetrahymena thermophila SB210]|uniref:Uncharacterized protein n=1 Tax=Tetrahymena thermophila (strain SB210) TaxID=312017 RepID=Q22US5_TETTS|nr:hypothetical protein TTHERM_00847050 [Tetrahymena thermophila SB210]EAR89051.1 hypothetical protein TTHERM_00847050 [Tetrahymena thermophila SB210]|eukprot:XP_001009296.1 hypothetical protein TTHERM_00847050 [Tetrahymena thermophila SB210]
MILGAIHISGAISIQIVDGVLNQDSNYKILQSFFKKENLNNQIFHASNMIMLDLALIKNKRIFLISKNLNTGMGSIEPRYKQHPKSMGYAQEKN